MTRPKRATRPPDTKLVVVYAGTYVDAGLAKSALEAAGVNAVLNNEVMGKNFPWYITPGGGGSVSVWVRQDDEAEARSILETSVKDSKPRSRK